MRIALIAIPLLLSAGTADIPVEPVSKLQLSYCKAACGSRSAGLIVAHFANLKTGSL